jgi:hypothetical protein
VRTFRPNSSECGFSREHRLNGFHDGASEEFVVRQSPLQVAIPVAPLPDPACSDIHSNAIAQQMSFLGAVVFDLGRRATSFPRRWIYARRRAKSKGHRGNHANPQFGTSEAISTLHGLRSTE